MQPKHLSATAVHIANWLKDTSRILERDVRLLTSAAMEPPNQPVVQDPVQAMICHRIGLTCPAQLGLPTRTRLSANDWILTGRAVFTLLKRSTHP